MKTVFGKFEVEACICIDENVETVEDDQEADFFSVYFRKSDGRAVCQKDFDNRENAESYAKECSEKYPYRMVRGSVFSPARFWDRVEAENELEERSLRRNGYIAEK